MGLSQPGRLVAALFLFLIWADVGSACPTCREALAASSGLPGQPEPAAVARGFNRSILTMAAMPFVLIAGTVVAVVRQERLRTSISPLR